MRGISSPHRAVNQQTPTKKQPGKWLKFKRDIRHIKDKIRSYVMDAFRNAKSIVEINKKIQLVERKVDTSLKASNEMEVKYRKSVNFKLLLLLGLWILDKIVLFAFFQWFNGQS